MCLKRQEDFVICFSEEIYPHLRLDVGIIHPTTGSIMDNCRQSARSATICGGVEFDDLVTGRVGPSYTFRLTRIKSTCKQVESAQTYSQMDPECTATTTKGDQDSDVLHKATDTLVKWVDDTIRDIEIQSNMGTCRCVQIQISVDKYYVHDAHTYDIMYTYTVHVHVAERHCLVVFGRIGIFLLGMCICFRSNKNGFHNFISSLKIECSNQCLYVISLCKWRHVHS